MSAQLAFVLADGSGNIQPAERRLIRHHCMQKRNKQLGSRRSRREDALVKAGQWLKAEAEARNKHVRQQKATLAYVPPKQETQHPTYEIEPAPIPAPSDWALFTFPKELDDFNQGLLHQYFAINPIRDLMCSFRHFGIKIDIDADPMWCFRLIVSQEMCFHAILLLASASNDLVSQQPLSKTSYRHLQRTLPLLNQRLSDPNAYRDDMVLYVIGILASMTIFFKDYESAQVHAAGISKIMRLRKKFGVEPKRKSMILLSVDRLNFCGSLATDLWIPVYNELNWTQPTIPDHVIHLHASYNMITLDGILDSELANVFRNLQHLSILFNEHFRRKTPLDGAVLHEYLEYIQSSLVNLLPRPRDILQNCIYRGIMSFLATTFRLPGSYTHPSCHSAAAELRKCYVAARASLADLPEIVEIWLAYTCLLATGNMNGAFDEIESTRIWELSDSPNPSWEHTRQLLRRVMWIDAFHDELGRNTFERLKIRTKAIQMQG
ncbi:unnamed protein product [Clonostachys rosea]|uniref:Transcription factor domain-containing protein n=1 Tax=Bionectria ochroleuca TaxID=29856 RepID=A0ABY6UI30_BIOOC|nr:unnamed protein product [Clonostachys rosea]